MVSLPLDHVPIGPDHDLNSLFEHDPFGKPVPTFPDHAVTARHAMVPRFRNLTGRAAALRTDGTAAARAASIPAWWRPVPTDWRPPVPCARTHRLRRRLRSRRRKPR